MENKLASVITKGCVLADEPMSAHTTFRTGGDARLFAEPYDTKELRDTLKLLRTENIPFYLIGNGSNLLVSDKGLCGAALHLGKGFCDIEVKESSLLCGAGASLSQIARAAFHHSLTGFEFAAGIPGSLGGAVVMNAGAYGGELRQVVTRVTLMDYDGNIAERNNEEMRFSYRHSLLKEEKFIVLSAEISLAAGAQEEIRAKMDDFAARRREKQPLEYPSAGSTFKRPKGHFAAQLIQEAGLKGFSVGGAQVSEKHCGFIVNKGNATSADIYTLMKTVQKRVMDSAGIALEPEVVLLGAFE